MGRLFERCLGGRFEVIFYSEHGRSDVGSLEELYLKLDVIMVASSLDTVPKRLKKLAEVSREHGGKKIVFDIATFKSRVVGTYAGFDGETRVASVHPMFGPGAKTTEGKRFIVFPSWKKMMQRKSPTLYAPSGGRWFFSTGRPTTGSWASS